MADWACQILTIQTKTSPSVYPERHQPSREVTEDKNRRRLPSILDCPFLMVEGFALLSFGLRKNFNLWVLRWAWDTASTVLPEETWGSQASHVARRCQEQKVFYQHEGGAASPHKEACVSIMRVSFAGEMIYPEKRRRLEFPCSTRALADGRLPTKGVQKFRLAKRFGQK